MKFIRRSIVSKNGKDNIENVFGLNDAETLQVLNLVPRETVELHLVIKDISSRLSEERQANLLKIISEAVSYNESNIDEGENWDDASEDKG